MCVCFSSDEDPSEQDSSEVVSDSPEVIYDST